MHRIKYFLVIAMLAGCGDTAPPETNKPQNVTANSAPYPKPVPVTVTIVSKHIIPGIKRGLDVRLDKKITKEILTDVAVKIKNADPSTYERTFITLYLPNMKVGAGAWATTHFNPDLEVRILGLTVEEEKTLRSLHNDPSHKVIGSWLEEVLKRRTTIFSKDSKTFIKHAYTDGSSGITELIEKISGTKTTFHVAENNESDYYYFIDKDGDLHASDGTFSETMGKKIE